VRRRQISILDATFIAAIKKVLLSPYTKNVSGINDIINETGLDIRYWNIVAFLRSESPRKSMGNIPE